MMDGGIRHAWDRELGSVGLSDIGTMKRGAENPGG